jgi:hypothetical protein
MGSQELDNLVRIGRLKVEAASRREYDGMVKSARRGLTDAQNKSIDSDSQFDLAIEAAHKFALAALRQHAIDPKIGLPHFRHSFTRWAQTMLISESF